MGDTPINLNSPEQLSRVIYGRKVIDKPDWATLIDPYMPDTEFRQLVATRTQRMYRTNAVQCPTCKGSGYIRKTKKNGQPFAKPSKCPECGTSGFLFNPTDTMAGFKFKPPTAKWASANGFSTSKNNLQLLEAGAKSKGMDDAVDFLSKVRRLSAVDTYLSSFVDGIKNYTKQDGMLHVSLLQHRTSTGRLSGANPNMQNMPRGGTFPVKKVFVSRFNNGLIMEADFAQLEFRTAAFLAQDETAMQEISTGFDVHAYTAKVITDAGQPTSRQAAKEHTFAPLFGASGYGRTKAEATYYKHFNDKYKGIANWHSNLADEALRFLKITNVSGRQYAFPDVTRRHSGVPTHFTMIKNYPVQGFATGDVVPVVLNEMHERLRHMKSCLVNTVHDSMVVDVHPDEKDLVLSMVWTMNQDLNKIIEETYGIKMNVPMLLEAKIGENWLDTVDV